jgi:hypothetical protein
MQRRRRRGPQSSGSLEGSSQPHFSFKQRLSLTFYAYQAMELKKDVIRQAHRLLDTLFDSELLSILPSLPLRLKPAKKQIKQRIAQKVDALLEEREALPHDLREYNDLHGLLRRWTQDLKALSESAGQIGLERFQLLLRHLLAQGRFRLHRPGKRERSGGLLLNLEEASMQLAGSPYHDAVLSALDLLVQTVPEMTRLAVRPLLERVLEELNSELNALNSGGVYVDLEALGMLRCPAQEHFLLGLLDALLQLRQTRGVRRLAIDVHRLGQSDALTLRGLAAAGMHLATVLVQVLRGWGTLRHVDLSGGRWVPASAIVRLLQRHEEVVDLDISQCRDLDSAAVEKISLLTSRLQSLRAAGLARVDGQAFEELLGANWALHTVDLSACDQLTEEDFVDLFQLLSERGTQVSLILSRLSQVDGQYVQQAAEGILGSQLESLYV